MASNHSPSDQFRAASDWLSSTPATANLNSQVKLELYGLFKYINTSCGPTGSRPSIFAPASRAKYESWSSTFARFDPLSDGLDRARRRYVEIAEQSGWSGQSVDEHDQDADLQEHGDDAASPKKERKTNAGLGTSVSVMTEDGSEHAGRPMSAIHEAVIDDSVEEVGALLSKDPNLVNRVDEFGYTPLHLAADRGYPSLVRILLDAGADREARDGDGQTPLMLAEVSGRGDIASMLREA